MATVFKSNNIATRFIADRSGFKGPADFSVNLSASLNKAFSQNGEYTLNQVLTSARNSKGSIYINESLEHTTVEPNALRHSFIPDINSYGILCDQALFDVLDFPYSVNGIFSGDYQTTTFAIYALKGKARFDVNDVIALEGLGTLDSPMYFKPKQVGTPAIIREDGATDVCIAPITPFMQTPFVPTFSSTTSQAEKVILKSEFIGRESGSVVIRFAEPARNLSTAPNPATEKPIIQLSASGNEYIAFGKSCADEKLIMRYFINGIENLFIKFDDFLIPNEGIHTFAAAWEGRNLKFALNGRSLSTFPFPASIQVSEVSVLSQINTWIPRASNNALLNLVSYSRALSLQELQDATKY